MGAAPHADPPGAALALLAVAQAALGGLVLRAAPGPARDAWLARLRALLPEDTPWRRLPPGVPDARLLGGLDLTATLRAGRPVAERGLLAEAAGGLLIAPMAERLTPGTAARLAAVLDTGMVAVERDGFAVRHAARLALVLLDEGASAEERPPAPLLDRLALQIVLPDAVLPPGPDPAQIAAARARLPQVRCPAPLLEALCGAALALGIGSLRAPLLAVHAACAAAALAGRDLVTDPDAALAAQLVLAPRATVLPAPPGSEAEATPESDGPDPPPEGPDSPPETPPESESTDTPPGPPPEPDADPDAAADPAAAAELVLAAAAAAIPPGLLALLRPGGAGRPRTAGRSGAARLAVRRGRPIGTRPGELRAGNRLALIETLRAAAPWQPLRRREAAIAAAAATAANGASATKDASAVTIEHDASAATGASPATAANGASATKGASAVTTEHDVSAATGASPATAANGASAGSALNAATALSAGTPAPGPSAAAASPPATQPPAPASAAVPRLHLRPGDIRIRRFRERSESTIVFLVDASGSQAAARLAEAKGAVELLLADCYVRRDRVALLAFRGTTAELLLPPTASLVRAKRSLAGLPGGGGSPVASGIDAALALAEGVRRSGRTPLLVLLTDGRANVGRDGKGGRPAAEGDALAAAGAVRAAGLGALLIDTSPRPQDAARRLAEAMAARYLPLPAAGAAQVSRAVRAAVAP